MDFAGGFNRWILPVDFRCLKHVTEMAFWAACGTRHANWCCPSTSSVNLENFHFSPKIAKLASLTVVTILRYLKKLNMLWTHKLVKTRPDHITSWEKSCQTNGCEAVAILSERSSRCTFFLCTRKSKKTGVHIERSELSCREQFQCHGYFSDRIYVVI